MLEGLEIEEIDYLLVQSNKDNRIDTQFWTKKNQHNPNLQYDKIGNCLIKAQYGVSIAMNEDNKGYPTYRMNEIHHMLCDLEVDKYAELTKDELEAFRLNNEDVLFNRTNSFEWVGRTGVYYRNEQDIRDYVFASYLVRFIPDKNIILPEYLTAFLNSKYGVLDIKRRARQSVNQTNVNPEEVKEIRIPLLNRDLQLLVKGNFVKAHLNLVLSKQKYIQAENLLLETLGLKNFRPTEEAINVKSFQESFVSTRRLDAEYYQPKYEEIEKELMSNNKCEILSNILLKIDTGEYSPKYYIKDETGGLTFYIRSTNIKEGQVEEDDNFCVKKEKFTKIAEVGDIITARVGTIGIFGEIRRHVEGAVYSDNVLCFRLPKQFNPSVYTLLFNTRFYYELIGRLARGSVQQRLNQETLKDVIVPIIDSAKQKQIAYLIEESFTLKDKSKKLLETAKRAVEIAIEESEEKAISLINKNN